MLRVPRSASVLVNHLHGPFHQTFLDPAIPQCAGRSRPPMRLGNQVFIQGRAQVTHMHQAGRAWRQAAVRTTRLSILSLVFIENLPSRFSVKNRKAGNFYYIKKSDKFKAISHKCARETAETPSKTTADKLDILFHSRKRRTRHLLIPVCGYAAFGGCSKIYILPNKDSAAASFARVLFPHIGNARVQSEYP